MTDEVGPLESERVEDLDEVLDERIDDVFLVRGRLVGEPVSLEVDADYPESGSSEGRHRKAVRINRTSPTRHEKNRGTPGISAFDGAYREAGAQLMEAGVVPRMARRKNARMHSPRSTQISSMSRPSSFPISPTLKVTSVHFDSAPSPSSSGKVDHAHGWVVVGRSMPLCGCQTPARSRSSDRKSTRLNSSHGYISY